MAKENPKRKLAKLLFVEGGLSQKEIAEDLAISQQTISAWSKDDSWKEEQQTLKQTPQRLIAGYQKQIFQIMEKAELEHRTINNGEGDIINKLQKAIELASNKLNPEIAMGVFVQFNNYLRPVDLDFTIQLTKYQKDFIQALVNNVA